MSRPTVLLVTGPPGTGKSTLAEHGASVLGAAVIGWDWIMAGLTPFDEVQDAIRRLSHLDYRRVGWSVAWNLATAQLRGGRSVVLDGVAREVEVEGTRRVAAEAGARCVVIGTTCSDLDVHRRRIEGRQRNIPGWHELVWSNVAEMLTRWEAPEADVHLDATAPLEMNLAVLERSLSAA